MAVAVRFDAGADPHAGSHVGRDETQIVLDGGGGDFQAEEAFHWRFWFRAGTKKRGTKQKGREDECQHSTWHREFKRMPGYGDATELYGPRPFAFPVPVWCQAGAWRSPACCRRPALWYDRSDGDSRPELPIGEGMRCTQLSET